MKRVVLSTLLLTLVTIANAQDQFGGHVSGQNWQRLTSPSLRVTYPKGMEGPAQRIAGIINLIDASKRVSVGPQQRRLDMLLHNQTVVPNGYVSLAPFRSEFFSTPPQSNLLTGSLDWLDILAIHEYRHALQITNAKRGLTKFGFLLQGELGQTLLTNLSLPNWYLEGDAVVSETSLSNSGRGRAPFFTMEQRALALADLDYSYVKHRNGSFRDLLPDHYRLGYMMLTHLRNEKGNAITADVLRDAGAYKTILYPFSGALKQHTGYSTRRLYAQAWDESKKKFARELSRIELIKTQAVTSKPRHTVASYRYPYAYEDVILARKSSYSQTDKLVRIKNGREKTLTTIGYNLDNYLSLNAGTLAWTESAQNARRGYQNFSDIVLYDVGRGTKTRLTKDTRYFSPAVSPDGKQVATIHITPDQTNAICLLNRQTGAVEKQLANPDNYFLSRAAWSENGQYVVSIAKHRSQLSLVRFDVRTGEMVQLTPWTSHTMESPFVHNGTVYVNAGYSGIDNIYETSLAGGGPIRQISSVKIGAYEPSVKDGQLLFTEFTEMGHVISRQSLPANARPITPEEPAQMPQFNTVANASEGGNILTSIPEQSYESKPFRGLFKGQKLHSWSIVPSVAKPVITVTSVNLMNDVQLQLGAGINRNEGNKPSFSAALRMARFYPDITLSASQNSRQTDYYSAADTLTNLRFNETKVGADLSVPLEWIKGNFRTQFIPTIGANYYLLSNLSVEKSAMPDTRFTAIHAGLEFRSLRRTARQNVGPRLGIDIRAKVMKSLQTSSSEKLTAGVTGFLPGLGANHNLTVKATYQNEPLKNLYQYEDTYEYTLGYRAPVVDKFFNVGAKYGMPLLYPEFGVAGITYFKRIRANLFYEYGEGTNKKLNRTTTYKSAGFELLFDNVMLNFLPMTFGIRQSYRLLEDPREPGKKTDFSFFIVAPI